MYANEKMLRWKQARILEQKREKKRIEEIRKRNKEKEQDEDIEFWDTQFLEFGKHARQTYSWVYENDKSWCAWALRQERPSDNLQFFVDYMSARAEQKERRKRKRTTEGEAKSEPVPLPIVSKKRKIRKKKCTFVRESRTRHIRSDNPVELDGLQKRQELIKHVARVFMPNYEPGTPLEDILQWATENIDRFTGACVEWKYDPHCEHEFVDDDGILHGLVQPVCWCTTPIRYIFILRHLDNRYDEFQIGSTCVQHFDSVPAFKNFSESLMKEFKDNQKGLFTVCQNVNCGKKLKDRKTWIRKNMGYCDNICAGFTCEYCQNGVALKAWEGVVSENWRSSYCCNEHYKLDNGYIRCRKCPKVFQPKGRRSLCKSCWRRL